MNWIYRFFCWAGGGNIEVLKSMPTEQNRFLGYGTVIFMTAIFATLSSLYAFSLLLQEQIGYFIIFPALAWGSFIFVLDRFFITTISNRGDFWRKFLMASPRLILSVFIGIIISKPLEFRIFQREINTQLADTRSIEHLRLDSMFRAQSQRTNTEELSKRGQLSGIQDTIKVGQYINDVRKRYADKSKEVADQAEIVNCECHGACGTGKPGRGPACKFDEQRYQDLQTEQKQLKASMDSAQIVLGAVSAGLQKTIADDITPRYKSKIDSLERQRKVQSDDLDSNYRPSILNQQVALASIQKDPTKPTAAFTISFITFLFIFIEMAPMLLKLMTKAGAYENRIAQIEATYSTDDRLNRSLDLEEYKSNRGLVQRLARNQRNIIHSAMDHWHRDQMNKMREDPEYFNTLFENNHDDNHQ